MSKERKYEEIRITPVENGFIAYIGDGPKSNIHVFENVWSLGEFIDKYYQPVTFSVTSTDTFNIKLPSDASTGPVKLPSDASTAGAGGPVNIIEANAKGIESWEFEEKTDGRNT